MSRVSTRRRDDRGAAALEYAGVVMLAAAMVLGLVAVTTPLGSRIAQTVSGAVCRILQLPGCPDVGAGATPLERATSGRYVAIGDSFSSGEGAHGYEHGTNFDDRDDLWPFNNDTEKHNRCRRSAHAYAYVLSGGNSFAGGTTFAACSGAVINDLTNPNHSNTDEPPQLDALGDDVSLVTLTISGNDLGFGDVLTDCVVNGARGIGLIDTCQQKHAARIARALPILAARLVEQYRQIAQRAPNARIVVVGYPPLFEENPRDSYRNLLFAEDQAWMNQQGAALDAVLRDTARQAGVEFVDPTSLFLGHGLGSEDPWFNDLDFGGPGLALVDPGSFHPNGEGQAAIAAAIQAQLENPR
jgi:lysophospholipase L1-like esterase/Flp pilus assembly pilin Flp